jgi:hypothetical protein
MSWHGIQYEWESRGICTIFSSENMQGINHFIDLIIDIKIILKPVKYESVERILFSLDSDELCALMNAVVNLSCQ